MEFDAIVLERLVDVVHTGCPFSNRPNCTWRTIGMPAEFGQLPPLRWWVVLFAGFALLGLQGFGLAVAAAPENLFDDHAPIALEIEAPFHLLINDRVGESEYHAGSLRYQEAATGEVVISLEIRTRGKTRRRKDICDFPPLRMRFTEADVEGTLFQGQRSLKLVTHCKDRDSYDRLVLQEYLAYRVYNLLTDYSHRVRLAQINYVQQGRRSLVKRRGFLLEHWKSVAARNDAIALDVDGGVNIKTLSATDANRVAVFQYLIGNEDYSLLWPETNSNCCHNSKPLFADNWVIPLPYDFDFAGIVNAPYAVPKPPNRSVRNRRYRGLCHTQGQLADTLEFFRERRAAIQALYRDEPGMGERERASTLAYLDDFYAVIDDPEAVERRLLRRCKKD